MTKHTHHNLAETMTQISESCCDCNLCVKNCAFLSTWGSPKKITDSYNLDHAPNRAIPFSCSLCRYCTEVCPKGVEPAQLFWQMRCELVNRGEGELQEHRSIKNYEKTGTSKRYTYYGLPEACDTVFFPGCALPGSRPDKVFAVFEYLQRSIAGLGVVLDCCTKPSHDLGRMDYFGAMFGEMREYLVEHGIRSVIVACPNCYRVFKEYGAPLTVTSVYEVFAEGEAVQEAVQAAQTITIHDPCAVRYDREIHDAVRNLVARQGFTIKEMPHYGAQTICCGEGGSAGFVAPELAGSWAETRREEAAGRRVITYCAGCAQRLNRVTPTSHLIDLLLEPDATMLGRAKVARPPFTYLNRLRLKSRFKRKLVDGISRVRTFKADQGAEKKGLARWAIFLGLIVAAIALRISNVMELDPSNLQSTIQGYGAWAPLVFMAIYSIAPSLFLPGLPLTLAGGILFGPFWGVVYSLAGATMGACLAFLVSRYLAREWVEEKLSSSKWQQLEGKVEAHGWKVVAFTRLIPLFPFNLLNYAFGLTPIGFWAYAMTTLICMAPGCIAYVLFSSSWLDLLQGHLSPAFVAGLLLIIMVSLLPTLVKRYKRGKERDSV